MNLKFLSEFPLSYIDQITDVIIKPRLWIPNPKIIYPDIVDWGQKVNFELRQQTKQAIICVNCKGIVLGLIIFQKHKKQKPTHYP